MIEKSLADLATQMQRLDDIEAIKQLKAKYIRLVDGKKWDEWGTLFTDDCIVHTEGGRHEGRDAVVKSVAASIGEGNTIHRVTMPEITITGADSATAVWGQQDVVSLVHGGKKYEFQGYGYYHEEYVRTPVGWKVRRSSLKRRYTTMQGWVDNA